MYNVILNFAYAIYELRMQLALIYLIYFRLAKPTAPFAIWHRLPLPPYSELQTDKQTDRQTDQHTIISLRPTQDAIKPQTHTERLMCGH